MRIAGMCAIVGVALLLVAGCSKPTVVGKWTTVQGGYNIQVEFKPDGTLAGSGTGPLGPAGVTGTWTMKEEGGDQVLTLTQERTLNGQKLPAIPPQTGAVRFDKDKFTFVVQSGSITANVEFTKAK